MEHLLGWSTDLQALETLHKFHFDAATALDELRRNCKDSGYFCDKFHGWTASEAAILCDNATRHQDHIRELLSLVPSKSLSEVMDFYNHFLRNSSLQELSMITRLFQAAEFARNGDQIESMNESNLVSGAPRKSKREKRPLPAHFGVGGPQDFETSTKSSLKRSKHHFWRQSREKLGSFPSGPNTLQRYSMGMQVPAESLSKQQACLRESFDFLHRARDSLEHDHFGSLIQILVAYDKGSLATAELVTRIAGLIHAHSELALQFEQFIPTKPAAGK